MYDAKMNDNLTADNKSNALLQSIKQYKEIVESDESFTEKGKAWYMMGQAYRQLADFKKAFTCFKKAAAHDYPEAFAMVSDAYLDGHGVVKNPSKARLWYRKGANMGEITATLKLADCYKNGIGGKVDYSKAMEQYLHLSERTGRFWNRYADGIGTALYEIGNMYLNGLEVTVDLKKAARYFKLAIKKGNTDAGIATLPRKTRSTPRNSEISKNRPMTMRGKDYNEIELKRIVSVRSEDIRFSKMQITEAEENIQNRIQKYPADNRSIILSNYEYCFKSGLALIDAMYSLGQSFESLIRHFNRAVDDLDKSYSRDDYNPKNGMWGNLIRR